MFMESDRVLALFKFGAREHIHQFVGEGLLYMNALAYFTTLEAQSVRRDPDEGAAHVLHHEGVRIGFKEKAEDTYKSIGPLAGPLRFRGAESLKPNVFCMYGLRASTAFSLVDPRNFAFGDTFVLLKDGDEFLARARRAALNSGHTMECRAVEYVDEAYSGPMGPFRKYATFSYQSEVRLALLPGTGAPYRLRLGSLSDIVALTGTLADVNRHIRVFGVSNENPLPQEG
jgi:hypothetical protein